MLKPIRILVADSQPLFREGLVALLSQQKNVCVVAEAANGHDPIHLFEKCMPDIAIQGLRMPGIDGITATEMLCRAFPRAKIILLSFSHTEEDVYRAFSVGAKACVLAGSETADLSNAIQCAMAGHITISPTVSILLAERLHRQELSRREKEVLQCIARGMTNAQIGVCLFVSEGTVKSHINRILAKLKVFDRTGATLSALRLGLVTLD